MKKSGKRKWETGKKFLPRSARDLLLSTLRIPLSNFAL